MAHTREDTRDKIIALVADQLHRAPETISESDGLDSLGADSLDRVELIMKFEEQFGIEINDDDAEKLSTIGQVIDYVHNLRK